MAHDTEHSFDAFISYRHEPGQKEIASDLQKRLERFTLKDPDTSGRPRRLVVFRDESELPVSEDLSKDIIAALDNSRYLIIVATPTYQASKWCMKELEYFRSLHGNTNHNIIPLLLEGEPEESFPSILREREKTIVDENGNQHTIIEEVEPLAADCRGATIAEQRRRLRKTECLRIAAPILGVAFDDLYRRHFRQSIYRGVAIAVVTLMVVLAFAALSISNQLHIAQERNGKLAAESNRLIEMANMEDDPTLAMMLAEQAFEVAPEDDSSHTRALEAFRTKTIDAAIADERSDLHPLMQWEFSSNAITVMDAYSNAGRDLVAITDSKSVYLCDMHTGDIVFVRNGNSAYFNEDASICVMPSTKNGILYMIGYNTATNEALFEFEVPSRQYGYNICVWFDEPSSDIYLIEANRLHEVTGSDASDDDNDGVHVNTFIARLDANYEATEDPVVPSHVVEAVYGTDGTGVADDIAFYDGYIVDYSYDNIRQSEINDKKEMIRSDILARCEKRLSFYGVDGQFYPDDSGRLYRITDNRVEVFESKELQHRDLWTPECILSELSTDGKRALLLLDYLHNSINELTNAKFITLRICDTTGEGSVILEKRLFELDDPLYLCATNHDMTLVAYVDMSGYLVVHDLVQDKQLLKVELENPEQVTAVAIEDKRYVLLGRSIDSGKERHAEVSVIQVKNPNATVSIDCTQYIKGAIGQDKVTHIELSEGNLLVCGVGNVFVHPFEAAISQGGFASDSMIYHGESSSGGNGSDPIPRYLTANGLLFLTDMGGRPDHSIRNHFLERLYDLNNERDVRVNEGSFSHGFAYDADSNRLAWEGTAGTGTGSDIHISALSATGMVKDEWSVPYARSNMSIPAGKHAYDGRFLLLENGEVTEIYDDQGKSCVLELNHTGLSLWGGKVYDVWDGYPCEEHSFDLNLDAEALQALSLRVRTSPSGVVREFTANEMSRYGIST